MRSLSQMLLVMTGGVCLSMSAQAAEIKQPNFSDPKAVYASMQTMVREMSAMNDPFAQAQAQNCEQQASQFASYVQQFTGAAVSYNDVGGSETAKTFWGSCRDMYVGVKRR